MNKFLETYCPSKSNQEEIDNLNRLIMRNEIEYDYYNSFTVYFIIILSTNKSLGPDGLTEELHQTYKDCTPMLKLFQKTEEKGTLPNSF